MGATRGGGIERSEPTLGRGYVHVLARQGEEIINRSDAVDEWRQSFEERRQVRSRAAYAKLGLWLLV